MSSVAYIPLWPAGVGAALAALQQPTFPDALHGHFSVGVGVGGVAAAPHQHTRAVLCASHTAHTKHAVHKQTHADALK